MTEIGPVEYMIVSFPGNQFKGEIAPALAKLIESNTIRIIDLAFVTKDADGNIGRVRAHRPRGGGAAGLDAARPRGERLPGRGRPDGRRSCSSRTHRQQCSCGRTSGRPSSRPLSGTPAASCSLSAASHTMLSMEAREYVLSAASVDEDRRSEMFRRRGGLVRAAATTAVVAGTAGAVRHRQDQKYAAQDQAAYEQQVAEQQAAARPPAPHTRCARLRRRAGAARAAQEPGHHQRGGVRGEEEADPGDLSYRFSPPTPSRPSAASAITLRVTSYARASRRSAGEVAPSARSAAA